MIGRPRESAATSWIHVFCRLPVWTLSTSFSSSGRLDIDPIRRPFAR